MAKEQKDPKTEAEKRYHSQLKSYLNDESLNSHNQEILKRLFRDVDLEKFARDIGHKRRLRYINTFRNLDKWFNHKPLEEITAKDFEEWQP